MAAGDLAATHRMAYEAVIVNYESKDVLVGKRVTYWAPLGSVIAINLEIPSQFAVTRAAR